MVREVNEMEQITAQVHAWCEGGACTVECTECGPLGVASEATCDTFAIEHMRTAHGEKAVRSA